MNNGGVLLGGGEGTRLFPTTKYINKHLIPIYDKPMIYYSLSILLLSGIRKITLVCSDQDEESFKLLLGNGEEFGIDLEYSIQNNPEGIPHGIAQAVKGKDYDKFLTVLGDNFIFGDKFFTKLESIFENTDSCSIFSQFVKNPENFGVVDLDNENKIKEITEKPKKFISNNAIIGLYIFNSEFLDHFSNINKSDRDEFEITDLIKEYNLNNVEHFEIGRGTAWFDMGTTDDFYNTSSFVRTIQERQGVLVCSPHEIALRNEWISEKEFTSYIDKIKGSEYSENLKTVVL